LPPRPANSSTAAWNVGTSRSLDFYAAPQTAQMRVSANAATISHGGADN
jgi:hypothetical protein